MKNILEFLEKNAERAPAALAFADTKTQLTYL